MEIRDRSADLRGRIMGENIRMVAGGRSGVVRHEFSGRIDGDTIKGTLVVGEGAARRHSGLHGPS